jgi:hypothetical protein
MLTERIGEKVAEIDRSASMVTMQSLPTPSQPPPVQPENT